MSLPFACPHCGEQTLVDDEFAGQSGPCINCGRIIVVPRFALPTGGRAAAAPGSAYAALHPTSPRSRYLFMGLMGLAVTAGMIALFAVLAQPVLEFSRANSYRRQCAANLRKIGAALQAYETQHGALPPAYVEDKDGNRLHSWRVLILPFLGPDEKSLAGQYDYRQPWNSDKNMKVAGKMPSVFRCPADDLAEADDETSYLVIEGKQTAFPGSTPVSRSQITDGAQNTIFVVEAAGTGITWTEPRDLSESGLTYQVGVDVGGSHRRGANVLLGTGEVRFLQDALDSEVMRGMSTINGNEPLPEY